jgi:signal transduction histidine kinase
MRLSIAAKIFAGFTAIMVLFGGVSAYSLVRMHQIQEDLRVLNRVYLRLNEAYVQLNLLVTEVHTLQNNLINLLDSIPEGRNTLMVTRWIRMARNHRLKRVRQGLRLCDQARTINLPADDRAFIEDLADNLERLKAQFKETDAIYEQLFENAEHDSRSSLPARVQVTGSGLHRRERDAFSVLRNMSNTLRRRLSSALVPAVIRAANRLEKTETRAFYATMIWAVLALILGLAITWGSQLTLRPLRRLADGARRIGRGEYGLRMKINSADEVGTLAREFNAMAGALQEREQRLIETERKAARTERMAAIGHLAAQITHEVRNPLSSISLNAEMLEEELAGNPVDSEEGRDLLKLIQQEVDRLTEITEEYLQFARMPTLKLEKEDLAEVIRSVFDLVRVEYEEAGIQIELDLDPSIPPLLLDENQLRRALLNIVKNAREAMETGGKLTVVARPATRAETDKASFETTDKAGRPLQPVQTGFEIMIRDTGPGILENQIPQIFEPFFSTKEKGTGLGLAITQQVIAEHNARLTVESTPDRGTTFKIFFPAATALPKAGVPPQTQSGSNDDSGNPRT